MTAQTRRACLTAAAGLALAALAGCTSNASPSASSPSVSASPTLSASSQATALPAITAAGGSILLDEPDSNGQQTFHARTVRGGQVVLQAGCSTGAYAQIEVYSETSGTLLTSLQAPCKTANTYLTAKFTPGSTPMGLTVKVAPPAGASFDIVLSQ